MRVFKKSIGLVSKISFVSETSLVSAFIVEVYFTWNRNLIFHKTWQKFIVRFFCYVAVYDGNRNELLGGRVAMQPGRAESVGWRGDVSYETKRFGHIRSNNTRLNQNDEDLE